jgi:hypothetical protein
MKFTRFHSVFAVFSLLLMGLSTFSYQPQWGFFAHRRINRLAVFCLPVSIIPFYKKNIEYLTEHAVDPDKRRYATRFEAPRHFIDLDQYGKPPFENLPRGWNEALAQFTQINGITASGDTLTLIGEGVTQREGNRLVAVDGANSLFPEKGIAWKTYQAFFDSTVLHFYYEDDTNFEVTELSKLLGKPIPVVKAYAVDHLSEHGILPYNLLRVYRRLTEAFYLKNTTAILRLSAEMGHYVGDAHVPLHTTKNYNGQLTNQIGIHGFWESRIPELFADERYDYFVGQAQYIKDPNAFFWKIIEESHQLVDSVLIIEKRLSKIFPQDQQYCFEDRMGVTIRTQCRAYAEAFQQAMQGMVERRMRETILNVASVWYSAWIDAGQPDLRKLLTPTDDKEEQEQMKSLQIALQKGRALGREHE